MRVLRRKEVALVRRIFVMVALALVVAVMMAVAAPAFAAIHQLARMECANGSASEVVQEQDPPGLEGQSNADNEMQSTRSVSKNDTAASHALKKEDCPAPNK